MLTRISESEARQLLAEPIHIRQKIFSDESGSDESRVKLSMDGQFIRPRTARFCILNATHYFYSPRITSKTYLQRGQWNPDTQQKIQTSTIPDVQLTSHDVLSAVPHLKLYELPEHVKAKYGRLTFYAREEDGRSLYDKLHRLSVQHKIRFIDASRTLDPQDRVEIVRYIFGDHTIIAKGTYGPTNY